MSTRVVASGSMSRLVECIVVVAGLEIEALFSGLEIEVMWAAVVVAVVAVVVVYWLGLDSNCRHLCTGYTYLDLLRPKW